MANRTLLSALGKIGTIIAVAVAFVMGLTFTVYLSLRSPEVKVPDVTGKQSSTGESALESAGLNMRKRATRYSADTKPDTILDQSPRAGEVVKVGQTVAVVISRAEAREGETSVSLHGAEQSPEAAASGPQENQNASESSTAKGENDNQAEQRKKNARKKTAAAVNKNANNSNANGHPTANNSNANINTTRSPSGNSSIANANRSVNVNGNRNINAGNNANRRVTARPTPTP